MPNIFPIDVLYALLDPRYGTRFNIVVGGNNEATYVGVDTELGPGEANLPAGPAEGEEVVIKKEDLETLNTVTVFPGDEAHTVEKQASIEIKDPGAAIRLKFITNDWKIIGRF